MVWFPPGLKHWHSASPTTAMSHIAIQESLNGQTTLMSISGKALSIPAGR
jgi:quercetin dioxygenase-like cupin family protein